MRIFFDTRYMQDKVIIEAGEYHTTNNHRIIYTVLGSCVSVCLKDSETGIAGMNHYMLPRALSSADLINSDAGRFGIHAMEMMVNEMLVRGADRIRLKAKVFGGAHVLDFEKRENNIPDSNVAFALKYLEMENIPVLTKDTGGNKGRRVMFLTGDGKVLVQKIQKTEMTALGKQECFYKRRLMYRKKSGDLTIFDKRVNR